MQNMSSADRELLIDVLNTASSWIYKKPLTPLKLSDIRVSPKTVHAASPSAAKTAHTAEAARTAFQTAAFADGTAGTIPVAAEQTMDAIAQKVARCSRCVLAKTRKNTVPGFGSLHPLVMVIGEGPGADEDETGLPFVGAAGKLLDKMLEATCLSRHTNCFIGNIVKCRPPHNRDPAPEEREACASFLHAQIHALKPKMILAVGRIAAQSLLETSEGIGKLHGRFFTYKDIPLMATYHPSALLRDASLKKPAWEDLKLFRSRLSELASGYTGFAGSGRHD